MRRRLRIHSYRDSRDGDVLISRHWTKGDVWDCACCGEENDEDDRFCWWCRAEKGEYVCERCGHRNKRDSTECEECGVERPDE